jgi:two-component system response regulator AtoC
MRLGAFDYITKPFAQDELLIVVRRALASRRLAEENIRLKKELSEALNFPNIVGESRAMWQVLTLLDKVSRTDSTVLLLGESGTGKELIASTIHYQSSRRDKPLIKVNCAALPDNLLESELFGYEKGAFTGAAARKPGRFEMADTGTIFLDEIGDLPPLTQTKLLRVLEERSFERLGGTETIRVDVRVIAATNKDLGKEIKKGAFREDLYYRLNVIPIELPPLRDRHDDIPFLIDRFVRKFNDQYGLTVRFSQGAVTELCRYSFPGNVRELINIVERCVTLADGGVVDQKELPPHVLKDKAARTRLLPLAEVAAEAEKSHILRILRVTQGNRTQAAEILGISRKTLWEKMNNYHLDI